MNSKIRATRIHMKLTISENESVLSLSYACNTYMLKIIMFMHRKKKNVVNVCNGKSYLYQIFFYFFSDILLMLLLGNITAMSWL